MSNFADYLNSVRDKLRGEVACVAEKDVPYGHQFAVTCSGEKVVLTIYNGKKGLRLVWGGAGGELRARLQSLVEGKARQQQATPYAEQEEAAVWAGSDESGKGDFFGPLVVAAAALDQSSAALLRQAGVKDCKLLSDKKILELAEVIMQTAVDYSVLELTPSMYNLRYNQIASQGGKLNQLLALGHIAALTQVLERQTQCQRALIDQFAPSDEVLRPLRARFAGVSFSQRPKAESDLAVAAASILARARFLRGMELLARQAGESELPKGGGALATECARRLKNRLGEESLVKFVKIHFANYKKL